MILQACAAGPAEATTAAGAWDEMSRSTRPLASASLLRAFGDIADSVRPEDDFDKKPAVGSVTAPASAADDRSR
jgi:hypothetical protein